MVARCPAPSAPFGPQDVDRGHRHLGREPAGAQQHVGPEGRPPHHQLCLLGQPGQRDQPPRHCAGRRGGSGLGGGAEGRGPKKGQTDPLEAIFSFRFLLGKPKLFVTQGPNGQPSPGGGVAEWKSWKTPDGLWVWPHPTPGSIIFLWCLRQRIKNFSYAFKFFWVGCAQMPSRRTY